MIVTLARTLRALREHTWLAFVSTGVIAASLVLVGMFGLIASNARLVLGTWEQDVHVSAYLPAGGTPEARAALAASLATRPEVAEARYVSEADAAAWMRERMPELGPVLDDLGENALPASIELTLRTGSATPEALTAFVASLQTTGDFTEVDYGRDWVTRVSTFLSVLGSFGVALGVLIGVAALFLVANTIHLVVYTRRDELEIMRLVGATDSYILAPFLVEGAVQGVLAASIATGVLWATHQGILSRLESLLALALGGEGLRFLPAVGIAGLYLGGVALGVGAAWGAVRRFLGKLA